MRRFALLAAVVAVPLAEIWLAAVLISNFGWGPVIIAAALVFGFGLAMVRRAGSQWADAVRKAQTDQRYLESGFADDFSSATLLMGGGVLMIIPGFITALLGALLVIPWTRKLVAKPLAPTVTRYTKTRGYERITIIEGETVDRDQSGDHTTPSGGSGAATGDGRPRVIEGEIMPGPQSDPDPGSDPDSSRPPHR